MDSKQFDQMTQTLGADATRRAVSRLLAGGALAGLAGWIGLSEEGEAKKKRKKKRKKKARCPSSLPKICPRTSRDPFGLCVPSGYTCCSDALGGGACEPATPQCCPPGPGWPDGFCAPIGFDCLLGYFFGRASDEVDEPQTGVAARWVGGR